MNKLHIIPAHPDHIPAIASSMREADRREVWASSRATPEQALQQSLACAVLAWTCIVDDNPAFMWGVSASSGGLCLTGIPWLLGTDAISSVSREFIRQSRQYVERMQEPFALLENYVHAHNKLSRRWLAWCGFIIEPDPLFINDEPFYRFWRI